MNTYKTIVVQNWIPQKWTNIQEASDKSIVTNIANTNHLQSLQLSYIPVEDTNWHQGVIW